MLAQEHVRAVTSGGRMTVPRAIRDHLGLRPGAMVRFTVGEDGRIVISGASLPLEEAYGAVPPLRRPEDFQALRDEAVDERAGCWAGAAEA